MKEIKDRKGEKVRRWSRKGQRKKKKMLQAETSEMF